MIISLGQIKTASRANFFSFLQKKELNDQVIKQSPPLFIQPKLTLGSPDDRYEKEADAMADKVMRMTMQEPIRFSQVLNIVNRKCAECKEEEKLQRKENSSDLSSFAPLIVQDVISAFSSKSLDQETRSFMEPRFGHDFSNVKIHDNSIAAKSADSINALAYTSGNNVVFNSGQYNTNSDAGKRLLAHELTHVVQQSQDGINQKHIQRLTASATGIPHDGSCGGFTRSFNFILDNVTPTDGFMVQKIERYDNEVKCPGMGTCPSSPSLTFYEAFFVRSGSTEFYRRSALGMTDQSGHAAKPNTSGARYAHGEIRFFPIAVTGNLGRNNAAGLWSPGNAGGVPASLSLPSTTDTPTWWDRQTEGPIKRYVNADWRCCGDSSDFNTVVANPS